MGIFSGVPGLDKFPAVGCLDPTPKPREVAPFLRSLRRMLENESNDVMRWTPDGRAFEILNMTRMQDEVLPKYFKHRKYTSFQRQLNYFSFKKWTKSKAVVCTFSNDFFLRDRDDLMWRITRKKAVHTLSSSTPRKVTTTANPNVKLGSVKLEPPQLQSFSTKTSSWKRDIAIRVPTTLLFGGPFGIGRPFPSPTDVDMMLLGNDVEPQKSCQLSSNFSTPSLNEQDVDSLEWIDNFLPSLGTVPRQDEPMFAGNIVNVSAGAFQRQTPHYAFPSLSGGDYTCLTSM